MKKVAEREGFGIVKLDINLATCSSFQQMMLIHKDALTL